MKLYGIAIGLQITLSCGQCYHSLNLGLDDQVKSRAKHIFLKETDQILVITCWTIGLVDVVNS